MTQKVENDGLAQDCRPLESEALRKELESILGLLEFAYLSSVDTGFTFCSRRIRTTIGAIRTCYSCPANENETPLHS